jgi:hypothetical protein
MSFNYVDPLSNITLKKAPTRNCKSLETKKRLINEICSIINASNEDIGYSLGFWEGIHTFIPQNMTVEQIELILNRLKLIRKYQYKWTMCSIHTEFIIETEINEDKTKARILFMLSNLEISNAPSHKFVMPAELWFARIRNMYDIIILLNTYKDSVLDLSKTYYTFESEDLQANMIPYDKLILHKVIKECYSSSINITLGKYTEKHKQEYLESYEKELLEYRDFIRNIDI